MGAAALDPGRYPVDLSALRVEVQAPQATQIGQFRTGGISFTALVGSVTDHSPGPSFSSPAYWKKYVSFALRLNSTRF